MQAASAILFGGGGGGPAQYRWGIRTARPLPELPDLRSDVLADRR
jgi:hypothetical protein